MKLLLSKLKDHDPYTYMHSLRVADLSLDMSKQLGLSEYEQKIIHKGGLFHDVGKLKIDPYILNKPAKLTVEEWGLIQQHPIWGFQMLRELGFHLEFSYIALFHHERCDGSGYPFGLTKESIPYYSHIVALADSFDAMVTHRPYSPSKGIGEVINEIQSKSGILFLPELVDALVECKKVKS